MKTKDKYQKSLSRAVSVQTPTARPRAAGQKAAADWQETGVQGICTLRSRRRGWKRSR